MTASTIPSEPVFWTAVLGLAGIAAAFFAPAWSQRAIGRRLERRRFRGASRLVADELNLLEVGLRAVGDAGRWPDDPEALLPVATWERLSDVLAPSLTLEDWRRVAKVYARLDRIHWNIRMRQGATIDATLIAGLRDTADRAREARDLLVTVKPDLD